ncbi:MAG: YdeI/OmpD-associated family protein [Cyclobacteriaceae bacterium]|nr:YdeI/OmpD-associated family protein [Cyclobacteriaceae bacterium]
MEKINSIDGYIESSTRKEELTRLRQILLDCDLTEEIKWGAPAYTFQGKNVAGLAAFKSYAGLWFHQGALLKDKEKKLINAQEGKTKALRQWRFTSAREIQPRLVKAYVKEAIQLVKDGRSIKPVAKKKIVLPAELASALKVKKVATNFQGLTPFKQREYVEYITEAARPETRQKRVEKIVPMILKGMGLNDKYRS